MLARLKSLPLTILLTILIWMYAEAQFTSVRDNVRLNIRLASPNPDLVVRVFDAQGTPRLLATVVVTLQGPKNQIDRIYQLSQSAISSDDEFSQLTYELPASSLRTDGAPPEVDTLAVLSSLPYFRQRGVNITAAVPPKVRLEVDTLEQVTRPVEFRPSVAVQPGVLIVPDQVTVNVPTSRLREIGVDKITVIAVPQPDLATLPVDVEQTVPVRYILEYPGAKDDRIVVASRPGKVTLRLPPRQGITQVVPDVPIWIAGPPAILAKNDVDIRTKTIRVTVTGSPAAIGALRQRLLPPAGIPASTPTHGIRAYLDLDPADRPAETWSTRKLRYVLPEGLTLQQAPADTEFRLTPKPAPATGPN